jgi:hypothetical protein
MKINYKLKEIYNRIFLVTIKDPYDLAMTFCRLQEYYESPFKQIRNKAFTMTEFQRLYAKEFGDGIFTYPIDWAGFNVPGEVFDKFIQEDFKDWGNEYDFVTEDIYTEVKDDNNSRYYLIAAGPKDIDTINHEICHALYYLDSEYKENVNSIISELNVSLFQHFKTQLLDKGYSKNVIIDEINAYLCFDGDKIITDDMKMNKKEKKNFQDIQRKLKVFFASTLSTRK